jgi:hypothetical protein
LGKAIGVHEVAAMARQVGIVRVALLLADKDRREVTVSAEWSRWVDGG